MRERRAVPILGGMTSPTALDSSGAAARPVRLHAARGAVLVLGGGFAGLATGGVA
jgi:hypothetical protein